MENENEDGHNLVRKEHDYSATSNMPNEGQQKNEDSNTIIDNLVNEICSSVDMADANTKEMENYFIKAEPQDNETVSFNPYNQMLGTGNEFVASLIEVVDNINEDGKTEKINISSSECESSDDSSSSEDEKPDWKPPRKVEKPVIKNEKLPKNKKNDPNQLPQIENIEIHLPQMAELVTIGKIISIIDQQLVVVKSYPDKPALNLDTVLFFDRDTAIGMVDETFGRVSEPHYVVRFNNKQHLEEKGVEIGREVFFAPQSTKYTTFIFMSELRKIRGSDASWKNDQEPPDECVDYSDDEQERAARKARKNKKTNSDMIVEPSPSSTARVTTTPAAGCNKRKNARKNFAGNRNEHWHNQQTRYNVPDNFESMMGWNNAINRMPYVRHRMVHSAMYNCNNPPPLNHLFNSPPPLSPQQMSPRFPIPPAFYQHPPPPPPPPSMMPPPPGFNIQEAFSNPWQQNQNNKNNSSNP